MDELTVRFWGTRGSIPTPGRSTEKFGGNTTCLELRYGDELIIFDAGSGIRELGNSWLEEFGDAGVNATLIFTHVHWDHIQGFPFFSCAYMPQNSLTIYGAERSAGSVRELLSGQMSGDWFPVPLTAMQAQMQFHSVTDEFHVGPVKIRSFPLPHPGGALGYRVEAGDAVFVLATDCELDQVATNREELEPGDGKARKYERDLLDFVRGAQLLVIDCQYTDKLYKTRVGWGHNSVSTVVDFCRQVHPGMLALFHHDPQSNDDLVTRMADTAARRLNARGERVLVLAAREGMTLKVHWPTPAPAPRGT